MSTSKWQRISPYIPLRRRRQPRSKNLRTFTAAAVLLGSFVGILRGLSDWHDAAVKTQPSNFADLARISNATFWSPRRPVRWSNDAHIDDRYAHIKALRSGQEGSVSLYADLDDGGTRVVVKQISVEALNKLPESLLPYFDEYTDRWPPELDASLSLGAFMQQLNSPYVPVRDYFILRDQSDSVEDWSWTMVTPFIDSGTLEDLAGEVRQKATSIAHIDGAHREALNELLDNLGILHSTGYCHDDVKPDNIFVKNPDHWLLGDLGQTREFSHPWHYTRLWRRRNQLSDCQLNDVRRALRTYLSFIRSASIDQTAFDLEFIAGSTAWAKLYWNFIRDPTSAAETLDMSYSLPWNGTYASSSSIAARSYLRPGKSVERELLCTSVPWKLWFIWS